MAYPSTFSSFNRPTASDRLNSPSHSDLHNTVSSAVGQLEAVIGLTGDSSVLGTILGDLRSPGSGGGGHVQTANKGGTGQTSFNKGDLLVGQSSSVITKLAVGSDGQILSADSSQSVGIKWVTNSFPKISASASLVNFGNTSSETSIFSVTIPGSTLGTSNVIRARLFVSSLTVSDASYALTVRGLYGSASVATLQFASIQTSADNTGVIEMDIVANNSTTSQRGNLMSDIFRTVTPYNQNSSFLGMKNFKTSALSQDSGANQTLGFTAQWNAGASASNIQINAYTIEKIA